MQIFRPSANNLGKAAVQTLCRRCGKSHGVRTVRSPALKEPTAVVIVGRSVNAHGNHEVESTWWDMPLGGTPSASTVDRTIVYDAAATTNSIVEATREGLSVVNRPYAINLITSRDTRLMAAELASNGGSSLGDAQFFSGHTGAEYTVCNLLERDVPGVVGRTMVRFLVDAKRRKAAVIR
jgi:hypothetical protein